MNVARGFLAAHSRCTTETIAQLLVGQAIGLHVAQHRDREQSRRSHPSKGLLELADKNRRARRFAVRLLAKTPLGR